MNKDLCFNVINANDVSLCAVENVEGNKITGLKSNKVGYALVAVTMNNGISEFKLIPVSNILKAKTLVSKYAGERLIDGDKELCNAYSTKRNALMTQKIAWCLAVLNNPGAWVVFNKLEKSQPYDVFDSDDNSFDISALNEKDGSFILRINNEEFDSKEFDEVVKKQLRTLWQQARAKEQGK